MSERFGKRLPDDSDHGAAVLSLGLLILNLHPKPLYKPKGGLGFKGCASG